MEIEFEITTALVAALTTEEILTTTPAVLAAIILETQTWVIFICAFTLVVIMLLIQISTKIFS